MDILISCWIILFVGIHLWAFLSPNKTTDPKIEQMWNDNF